MKKIYHLNYEFLGGQRHVKTESLFVFAQALDKAMDDPNVPNDVITFYIEEVSDKGKVPNK